MYLQPAERAEAPNLFAALQTVQASIMAGNTDVQALEAQAAEHLSARGWPVDYLSLRRQRDLLRPQADEIQMGEALVIVVAAKQIGRAPGRGGVVQSVKISVGDE